MSNYPVKAKRRAVEPAPRATPDVVSSRADDDARLSFRYAYASISLEAGKARVKARRARWMDGKLESESFEGDVDPSVFERAVEEAQRQFLAQTAFFWQSVAAVLPFHGRRGGGRN